MNLSVLAAAAPLQSVRLSELEHAGIEWSMWRLDQIDSTASGNKLFKLAENFRAARAAGFSRVLSFGGAFSNHIHALALLGRAQGFETIGVIRGEDSAAANPTLRDAQRAGMRLHFVDREQYRHKQDDEFLRELQARFGPCYIVPEGGANRLGVLGCRALGATIGRWPQIPNVVALACGTGSTLAGIVAGLENRADVLGIAVLKGAGFLVDAVRANLYDINASQCTRWCIDTEQHGGGYARVSPALSAFVVDFERRTGIPIEPVYTGKMVYAIYHRVQRGEFARGTRVLTVHTGGLQGARSGGATWGDNDNQQRLSRIG